MDYSKVMTSWLDKNDVPDKDSTSAAIYEKVIPQSRKLLRKKEPDAVLDLHGKTRDEAWPALEAFFDEQRHSGAEKVLIIHGKGLHSAGDAVLEKAVREFIEKCDFAGESGHSPGATGGSGSTWVLLKVKTPAV
jgi:DNA-nicking Smr family endonuclease